LKKAVRIAGLITKPWGGVHESFFAKQINLMAHLKKRLQQDVVPRSDAASVLIDPTEKG
jgi:hypothetical protein